MLPIQNQTHRSGLFCDMTVFSHEQREAHIDAIRQLLSAVHEALELPDGYALRFAPDLAVLLKLAEFISGERLCCPFLNFDLRVEAEGGPVWLRLTGPEGVKEFLWLELGGFGNEVVWETDARIE